MEKPLARGDEVRCPSCWSPTRRAHASRFGWPRTDRSTLEVQHPAYTPCPWCARSERDANDDRRDIEFVPRRGRLLHPSRVAAAGTAVVSRSRFMAYRVVQPWGKDKVRGGHAHQRTSDGRRRVRDAVLVPFLVCRVFPAPPRACAKDSTTPSPGRRFRSLTASPLDQSPNLQQALVATRVKAELLFQGSED
jgi:hypothetical protein